MRRRLVLALPLTWLLACGVLAAIVVFTGMVDEAVRSDVFRARLFFSRLGVDVVLSAVSAARVGSPPFYVVSLMREVGALHAQLFR